MLFCISEDKVWRFVDIKQCFSTPSPRKALDESAESSGVRKH